jgi:predicted transcriptional regulator
MAARAGVLTKDKYSRLTITLAPGQKTALEQIAELNHTTYAFVVRYAISKFIEENREKQLPLTFPTELP